MIQTNIEEVIINNRRLDIYLPPSANQRAHGVLYVHDGKQFMNTFHELLPLLEDNEIDNLPIIVAIHASNRLDEYTPWAKNALDPRFPPFGGLGDDYLTFLCEQIKPYIDTNYLTVPDPYATGMMGFSLGGLISIYAAYTRSEFGIISSISGSFWYDGWPEYLGMHQIKNPNLVVQLLSGKNEGLNKDNLRQQAAQNTILTKDALSHALNCDILVQWDNGGHHDLRVQRHTNALRWIIKQFSETDPRRVCDPFEFR